MSEISNAVLEERVRNMGIANQNAIAAMQKEVDDLEDEIAALKENDKKTLRAGISLLGSVVLSLVGIIWAIVSGKLNL